MNGWVRLELDTAAGPDSSSTQQYIQPHTDGQYAILRLAGYTFVRE